MSNKVVTVSVEASVAGYNLSVSGATLSLGVNAIPLIELACAPTVGKTPMPLVPEVSVSSASSFAQMYRTLAEKAEGLEEDNTRVSIKVSGDYEDSISLSGWILSGVGMSSVSATSAPYLSIMLQHPICQLTKVGSICETPRSSLNMALNEAVSGAGDILGIISAVYGCVGSRDDLFWPPPAGFESVTEFRHALKEARFSPGKHLVYSGSGGIFLCSGSGDGEAAPRFVQAIGRMVLPMSGGSAWDMILKMSGMTMLNVVQDQANNYLGKQLVLEPIQPWKTCSITLDDSMCMWTELPGMDPFRISGVMARKLGPYSDPITLGLIKKRNGDVAVSPNKEVMYSPKNVPPSISNGRIMQTTAPAVLEAAFRRDAWSGETITEGMADLKKLLLDGYDKVLGKYCQAVYETTSASMSQAKAQMVLCFRDVNNNLILPGNTCKYVAHEGGKSAVLYYGYIRSVVHDISVGEGCHTSIQMAYVRPEESFKVGGVTAIAAGAPNAAYK